LGAVLNVPLFDGFQRRAGVDLNRARVREAIDNHSRVLQQALLEVDNALAQERDQGRNVEALEEQLTAAREALDSARDRYRQGLNDFLPVLTALQGVQQTELAILSARRQRLSYRVQLHRALGGAWTRRIERPRPKEPSR
jgi:outer membrane protein TolC